MSEAGVALGLQQVVAEVHDHEPGEGVEQPAAHHAQLVVVQPQLLQPRHRREQRRGQRHDAVTCNIRTLLDRSWKVHSLFEAVCDEKRDLAEAAVSSGQIRLATPWQQQSTANCSD